MPFVSSSGGEYRLHVEGPNGGRQRTTTLYAYIIIAVAMILSLFALVRLGNAASRAVASVSGAHMASGSHAAVPRFSSGGDHSGSSNISALIEAAGRR